MNQPPAKWCTISTVQNGWLVQLTPLELSDLGSIRRDDMLVFKDTGTMSAWVRHYFGGSSKPIAINPAWDALPENADIAFAEHINETP